MLCLNHEVRKKILFKLSHSIHFTDRKYFMARFWNNFCLIPLCGPYKRYDCMSNAVNTE